MHYHGRSLLFIVVFPLFFHDSCDNLVVHCANSTHEQKNSSILRVLVTHDKTSIVLFNKDFHALISRLLFF